jgi:hypothetical protein
MLQIKAGETGSQASGDGKDIIQSMHFCIDVFSAIKFRFSTQLIFIIWVFLARFIIVYRI